MNTKKRSNLSMLLLIVSSFFIASCDKDNGTPNDPENTITLNMYNEENGKTLLGTSSVYINKSNNFYTPNNSFLITDIGEAKGIGANVEPKLNNLVQELAVLPNHLYQVFEKFTTHTFPSGENAVRKGANYYKSYVVSPIKVEGKTTGAVVKIAVSQADAKGLPEWDYNIGVMYNEGDRLEYKLPKGSEYEFIGNNYDNDHFNVFTENGKLVIHLDVPSNQVSGPWGTYRTYIRIGSVYSSIVVSVQ